MRALDFSTILWVWTIPHLQTYMHPSPLWPPPPLRSKANLILLVTTRASSLADRMVLHRGTRFAFNDQPIHELYDGRELNLVCVNALSFSIPNPTLVTPFKGIKLNSISALWRQEHLKSNREVLGCLAYFLDIGDTEPCHITFRPDITPRTGTSCAVVKSALKYNFPLISQWKYSMDAKIINYNGYDWDVTYSKLNTVRGKSFPPHRIFLP